MRASRWCRNLWRLAKPYHICDCPPAVYDPATLRRILVLTEKGIEESGSHEELLAAGGLYSRLYNMQFAGNA